MVDGYGWRIGSAAASEAACWLRRKEQQKAEAIMLTPTPHLVQAGAAGRRKAVGEAVFGGGSVDGGTVGDGCALPAAVLACVPVTAAATAPASEKADPATDSSVGSGERREGESDLRQNADGAVDCVEASSGAGGVLERLGAEGADESRGEGAIVAA